MDTVNAFSEALRDDYAFKFVSSTSVAAGGNVNITLAELGWQWGIIELGEPAAVAQFSISTGNDTYLFFATAGRQFRAVTFRIDPLSTVSVTVAQFGGGGSTGVILNVARGYPVIPVHSH